ncbi:hypothetical protein FFT09_10140 [Saccharomonospora piscinae]|uniref:hypothetical protein n=1 Tax=Saccharomonospora piscinae TaxID=687388 RepID=UPI0011059376|nr:hypothetical protein [Saccharomonospora piscinae]TLW93715.1 hypothetical protein FFT09_10140 [Saccharomonospora piscinae]
MSEDPDIAFTTRVTARRLRWHEDPDTSVSFHGSPGHRSESRSERDNLPERVRAGQTYRDVTVDYHLWCALADQSDLENGDQDGPHPDR